MGRAAIAILSTENLLHNLRTIQSWTPNAGIIAMVKANAYGHGLRSVAMRLDGHVQSFGVASIDEALALRKVGIKKPITLMEGVFEPDELLIAACQKFTIVLHNHIQIDWLLSSHLPCSLQAWIKVDTGMGRLGFTVSEGKQVYAKLQNSKSVKLPLGLMSHFAQSENSGHPLNNRQIELFNKLAQNWQGPKSMANSAAILNYPDSIHDVVRPGIALYGVSPMSSLPAAHFNLKPVMTLQTRLIGVRHMSKGNTIGYGSRFTCETDMPVGVIAMGYGDGYPRTSVDGTPMLVNGIKCHLVGIPSMDMMTIDLRACPHAKIGDTVTLWGDGLPIEEVAQYTAHIPYDMLCAVQSRVKFHWTVID